MGLFGGGNSASSTTNLTEVTETAINQADYRSAEDEAIIEGNQTFSLANAVDNTINVRSTDLGAVQMGVDLASQALDFGSATIRENTEAVKVNNASLLSGVEKSINLAAMANESESSQAYASMAQYALYALGGLGALYIIYKKVR